jgi:hypothetical protein
MSGDTKKPGNFFSDPTRRATQPGDAPAGDDPLRNKTRRVEPSSQPRQQQSPSGAQGGPDLSSQATRLWRPGQQGQPSPDTAGEAPAAPAQAADEFVVGWLVVIGGPGQGQSLPLGYGLNGVGRGADQQVCLDFGDSEVSRENHFSVAYDGRNRKFFIQHGGGRNLTYLGDTPVLSPMELAADATITIGSTTLRFVPFCGDAFDWSDLEGNGAPQE